jgi:hypothetical protein
VKAHVPLPLSIKGTVNCRREGVCHKKCCRSVGSADNCVLHLDIFSSLPVFLSLAFSSASRKVGQIQVHEKWDSSTLCRKCNDTLEAAFFIFPESFLSCEEINFLRKSKIHHPAHKSLRQKPLLNNLNPSPILTPYLHVPF